MMVLLVNFGVYCLLGSVFAFVGHLRHERAKKVRLGALVANILALACVVLRILSVL